MQSTHYSVMVWRGHHGLEITPRPRSRRSALEMATEIAAKYPFDKVQVERRCTKVDIVKTIKPPPVSD